MQIEHALANLSSDEAFANLDITSCGQVLRMIWHRFWIGKPTPIALNDHGQKRIMWLELLKRLG